jgi:hypothetical protein
MVRHCFSKIWVLEKYVRCLCYLSRDNTCMYVLFFIEWVVILIANSLGTGSNPTNLMSNKEYFQKICYYMKYFD